MDAIYFKKTPTPFGNATPYFGPFGSVRNNIRTHRHGKPVCRLRQADGRQGGRQAGGGAGRQVGR